MEDKKEKNMLNKLIDLIIEEEDTIVGESEETTGYKHHIIYRRKDDLSKKLEFDFYSNYQDECDVYTCLMCMALDLRILSSMGNLDDFMRENCYDPDSYEAAKEKYDELVKERDDIENFFTAEELEALDMDVQSEAYNW